MPGGRGRGGPMPREVQVSKALSKLLRHSAEKEGLQLDAAGYINLKDVVGLIHAIPFSMLRDYHMLARSNKRATILISTSNAFLYKI